MSIDMEQFKATFVEESLEGLDTMESVLLELQPGNSDSAAIDDIFRAAHSIKGGSATFGFEDIAAFTHVVETLLDQIRNGERPVTQEAIDLFLSSVDCIRDLLSASQGGDEGDQSRIGDVKRALDAMLGSEAVGGQSGGDIESEKAATTGWQIHFRPYPDMLRTGNDVVRMFRELDELGVLDVSVDSRALPTLAEMDTEEAYLAWDITLRGDVTRSQIDEIFEWVEGECDLAIEPLAADSLQSVSSAKLAAVPEAEDRREGAERRDVGERRKTAASGESSSIRVSIDKVDDLINMVGELVITQSMLSQLGDDFQMERVERLKDGLAELERNTRELQESVMRIRMLPISFAFNRFPRMVHDLSAKLGKKIELTMSGEQTDLDKTVMEKIGDPLVHLVRNAIDHGIESPEVRVAAGKPETGNVHLNAYHQGGNIMIEISDDGAGLNRDKIFAKAVERGLIDANDELPDERVYDLLFEPGFSTADVVSDVSGRGVGMDVVKRNIMALSGSIEVATEAGKGSTFTIRLPLTLAILDGQLISVGDQIYIVPLVSIVESLQINQKMVNAIAGKNELYQLREDYLPIVRLYKAFGVSTDQRDLDGGLLVVVEGEGKKVGLLVDDLLGQQQVVIKSLETNYKKVDGISGATILGDGTVALIVDVAGIIRLSKTGSSVFADTGSGKQIVAA
jgi:two-component system chemotaxis sensor kinase CheA